MRFSIRELWLTCMIGALFLSFHFFDVGSVWTKPIGGSYGTRWHRPWGTGSETDVVVEDEFNKNSRLEWGKKTVPQTKIPVHLSGQSPSFESPYLF